MLRYSVLQQSLYLACNTLEMNARTILSNTCGKTCGKAVEKMWKSTIFRGCKSRHLGVNRGI